jgi:hypothetical protein
MNIMRMLLEHENMWRMWKQNMRTFFVICHPLVWKIIQHNLSFETSWNIIFLSGKLWIVIRMTHGRLSYRVMVYCWGASRHKTQLTFNCFLFKKLWYPLGITERKKTQALSNVKSLHLHAFHFWKCPFPAGAWLGHTRYLYLHSYKMWKVFWLPTLSSLLCFWTWTKKWHNNRSSKMLPSVLC